MADEQPEFHDVVVIGAGVAGLRCASQLAKTEGVTDVLVVEASGRVGGRVMNDTSFIPGMSIEVGAEFMHGANTTLTRLAKEHNIGMREIFTWAQGDGGPTDPAPDGGIGYYYIGDQKRMLKYDDVDEEFLKFNLSVADLSDLENIDHIPPTKSMRDYFNEVGLSRSMMKLCESGYANTAGGPLEDISMRTTCRYEKQWIDLEDEGDFRVVPSFMRFVNSFSMRRAGKVLLHMSGRFWPEDAHGVICSECFLPEFWFNSSKGIGHLQSNGDKTLIAEPEREDALEDDKAQYLITGYAGALYAESFAGVDHDKIIENFLDQLDMIYGTVDEPKPAHKHFVRGMYKDWGDEPWIGGGYAFPLVGQSDTASHDLAAPVDNRIFFAGEATAFEQPGMSVHAAIDTGTRASVQAARALQEL